MNYLVKKNRVALFSSYFLNNELPFYIKFYIEKLQPYVNDIIFITNEEKVLNEASLNWLKNNTSRILFVKNEGYDFGMWQKALNTYNLDAYEEIVLCNDSCICFADFEKYFEFHDKSSADVTGLTLSNSIIPHLQSYFLTIKGSAKEFSIKYIKQLELGETNYIGIVSMGEIGLSLALKLNQYNLDAFFRVDKTDVENPTYAHCVDLINIGSPLIKRKLLKEYDISMMFHLWSNYKDYKHIKLINHIKTKYSYTDERINKLFEGLLYLDIPFSKKIRFYRKKLKKNITELFTRKQFSFY